MKNIKNTKKLNFLSKRRYQNDIYCAGWMSIDVKVERLNNYCEFEEVSILEEFID